MPSRILTLIATTSQAATTTFNRFGIEYLFPTLKSITMPRTKTATSKRRHDLDNLHPFLTALVFTTTQRLSTEDLDHGSSSQFFNCGSLALVPFNFNFINQFFFMGPFFWLSGLLLGNRLSNGPRKESRWSPLRSKWFHLGLPAIIYTVMTHPLSMFLASSLGSNLLTQRKYNIMEL